MDSDREVPGVFAKLNEVMGKVGRIPKTGRNDFHGYDYATEADIVDEIRPLMTEAGLAFIPSQGGERREVTVQTKSGETTVVKILHTFRFVDTEDGSEVEISVWGEGQDSMDKGSYKAFTGAEKYALLKTFMVATGDDPERDASHARPTRSRPSEKQQKATGDAGHTCPDCGSDIWINLEDPKAAANGGKRPNFKCKDKDCDWASWDSEDEVFGSEEGYGWADGVKDAADPDTVREIENVLIELAAPFPDYARRAHERFDDLKSEGKLTQEKAEDALDQFREKLDEASEDEDPDKDEWDDRADVLMWFETTYGDEWEAKLNLFLSRHPDLSTPHEKLDRMSWNRISRFVDEHDREGVEDPRQVLQTEAAL